MWKLGVENLCGFISFAELKFIKMVKRFLIIVTLFVFAKSLNAQDFFADEQSRDTVKKPFYQTKYHGSLIFLATMNDRGYGVAGLLHFNKERFSPYFEFRYTPNASYSYKLEKNNDEKLPETIVSDFNSSEISVSIGIASSPVKQLLLYANTGFRIKKENEYTQRYPAYSILPSEEFPEIIYGGGMLYVLPIGLSVQLGIDFSKMTFVTGLGFTL